MLSQDQISLQTSHKIHTTTPQLLTLSVGTWNCGRRKDKNYVWTKGGCQETSSVKREPWFAAVRALRETLWSAFSPLSLKHSLKRSRKRKETWKRNMEWRICLSPPTTNLSRTIRMDFDLEAVMQLKKYLAVPMTLLAKEVLLRVARPKSPILTDPVGPVMKMLSHLRSRWMMGGDLVWRKCSPFRICRHQLRRTLIFISLNRFRYLQGHRKQVNHSRWRWRRQRKKKNWQENKSTYVLSVPDVMSSVTRTIHFLPFKDDSQES